MRGVYGAALLLALVVAGAAARAAPLQGRATTDRPDDVAGPQLHAIYVVPSDGTDEGFDTSGDIQEDVLAAQSWLYRQTGRTRILRLDTYQGRLDVTFFRSARSRAQLSGDYGETYRLLRSELGAAGFASGEKVYAAYLGAVPAPPDIAGTAAVGSRFGLIWLDHRYAKITLLHETLHALGFVPGCSPHSSGFHATDGTAQEYDLMAGRHDLREIVLDVGRDDYYGAGIAGCLDLATNSLLREAPPRPATLRIEVARPREFSYRIGGSVYVSAHGTCSPGFLDEDCRSDWLDGAEVELEANWSKVGSATRFLGWSGDCSGEEPTCRLVMTADKTVTARFARTPSKLTVVVQGRGFVKSLPLGISCNPNDTCSFLFNLGDKVTLTEWLAYEPFAGWGGDCRGRKRTCTLTMSKNRVVRAIFKRR